MDLSELLELTKISKANPSFATETYWMIPGSPHTLALNGGLHIALWALDRPSGAVRVGQTE